MPTTLVVAVNGSLSDTAYDVSGANWIDIVPATDSLIFSNGSAVVADGNAIPSQTQLIQAAPVLSGVQQVVTKCFLADASTGLIEEIKNAGNQNKRYVFAFDFDGATASEPVLEVWDDSDLDSVLDTTLGAGTPSNSWWRGIVTTSGLPGANWALTGTRLAGSTAGNYLSLNNGAGALIGATILYCNLAIVIPASATAGGTAQPKICIKYTSN